MSRPQDHLVIIERRGRSHRAVCECGWRSHAWNELRPAEADAWHHVYGDDAVIDISAIPDERSVGAEAVGRSTRPHRFRQPPGVDDLVRLALDLASRPSPYTRGAAPELWRAADHDHVALQTAMAEIEELLSQHDRQSAGTADSEWLVLITAKRLLVEAMAHGNQAGRDRRALI